MKDGFICVAAGIPAIRLGDCRYNAEQIFTTMRDAESRGVKILALPELGMTGYTCGDLFFHDTLLQGAEDGLRTVLEATRNLEVLTALGLPLRAGGKLFNCAAVIQKGEVLAVIPKRDLPGYGEFSEPRWFAPGSEAAGLTVRVPSPTAEDGYITLPLGSGIIDCPDVAGLKVGVELCEDLWSTDPPSRKLCEDGATVILNLSASNDVVGKAAYRRQLVMSQSARMVCGYVFASAGEGESTTDLVFGGHHIIAENGELLANQRFAAGLSITELDIQHLTFERRRLTGFSPAGAACVATARFTPAVTTLHRQFPASPFVPASAHKRMERCEEILSIAALGLKHRIAHTGAKAVVIGLSGGLDSTLALLITAYAMGALERSAAEIIAVTMPCFGTTDRTLNNAIRLAEQIGATLRTIPIADTVRSHLNDIGHDINDHSVTYENAQARERTQVLMDIANQVGGLVIGTGDLSELALGWATYNGDHMSMYGVNADIPKTMVRELVDYVAQRQDQELRSILKAILDTPVSPELLPAVQGNISQITEDLVGPYELHDFFLYHFLRWGSSPKKILRLALKAHGGHYEREIILKWLKTFCRRFFAQQFKRSCLPDGPKVGAISLSPRGDWKMPSDATAKLWLEELEEL